MKEWPKKAAPVHANAFQVCLPSLLRILFIYAMELVDIEEERERKRQQQLHKWTPTNITEEHKQERKRERDALRLTGIPSSDSRSVLSGSSSIYKQSAQCAHIGAGRRATMPICTKQLSLLNKYME